MSANHRLKERETILLYVLLAAAFVLRFYRLGFDSFWLDELYVANETDPRLPLGDLFHSLKCCDQHPPLFYLAERCLFFFFGQSETTARILPAAAGVASVYAIYLLGKEIVNKRLGLVAAALTCVNHFHIHYSREARGYMFVFLFSTLSLVFLFRLIKFLRRKDVWFFSLFALLTMYSHYFGVLLVFSEFCAAALLFIGEKEKKLFAKRFALSGLLIFAGYLVWAPVLLSFGKISSFWIPPLPDDWILRFFGYYFGDTPDLIYIMAVLLAIYLVGVFARRSWKWPATNRSALVMSWVLLGAITVLCYAIPYIRGLMVTPMLADRYTIVILPCMLIFIAYGIELVPFGWLRYAGLAFLLFFSLQREIGFLKTWSKPQKTEFRDVTAFMAADPRTNHYPILNDRIGWFESYYVRKFGYPGPLLEAPRAAMIDSIVKGSSPAGKTNGFWLMDAHQAGDPGNWLDPASRRKVDSLFIKVKERQFLDAWAQLYVRRSGLDDKPLTANRIR